MAAACDQLQLWQVLPRLSALIHAFSKHPNSAHKDRLRAHYLASWKSTRCIIQWRIQTLIRSHCTFSDILIWILLLHCQQVCRDPSFLQDQSSLCQCRFLVTPVTQNNISLDGCARLVTVRICSIGDHQVQTMHLLKQ